MTVFSKNSSAAGAGVTVVGNEAATARTDPQQCSNLKLELLLPLENTLEHRGTEVM